MYSFHSSPEEKNRLLFALTQHGIETTVDRMAKKERIRDWIQESVIQEEEDDEGDEQAEDDGRELQTHTSRAPVAGHVSSVRAAEKAARKSIVSTVKDASNKHINPRTGKIQQGPSEMGHQSNEMHSPPNDDKHNETTTASTSENNRDRNGNGYHHHSTAIAAAAGGGGGMIHRRTVGSQTTIEAVKRSEQTSGNVHDMPVTLNSRAESYEIKNSHSVPTVSNAVLGTNRKTQNGHKLSEYNGPKLETSSRGYVSAFNSLATIAVPEIQQYKQPIPTPVRHRNRDRSQSTKHSQHQRHNASALAKQPISRSMHNFNNLINDSGYGSLDKLRPIDNSILSSPIFSKRSGAKPTNLSHTPNGAGGDVGRNDGGGESASNERIHINGMSHSQNENSSPFHSDSGGDGSPRGSNGFVNLTGTNQTANEKSKSAANSKAANLQMTMKGTAYDQVRSNRKNQWNDF